MRDPERVLNSLAQQSKISMYRFERLYRILFNKEIYYVAYQKLYAKEGNMTPGVDGKTIDDMSIFRIEQLIELLKSEQYQPVSSKRIYIPKKNGSKRPLGIPSFDDKLVQEVIRMILEAIYEDNFESCSHGFRPNRGCHTALSRIKDTFTGSKWFVEGDIKGFFDNIDHDILIRILEERISDNRFIRLIRKFLNVGYMEEWTFHRTYSGTPQGGIISPILANIYLDKFDKYMNEYIHNFNEGKKRKPDTVYAKYALRKIRAERKLKIETDKKKREFYLNRINECCKARNNYPSLDEMDSSYRRLKYIRYADDFLIGIIGSKADCVKVKKDIKDFLGEKLNLELSDEKTLITNTKKNAKFLGYEIGIYKTDQTKRIGKGTAQRYYRSKVFLKVSMDTMKKKLFEYDAIKLTYHNGKERWHPKARPCMKNNDDLEILCQYNGEIRGFYNYYSLANNSYTIDSFYNIMEYSMYKTYACKYKSSVRKVLRKYSKNGEFGVDYIKKNGKTVRCEFYHDGFKRKPLSRIKFNDDQPLIKITRTSLIDRIKANKCEICGAESVLSMHHVKKLKDLQGKRIWEKHMIARRRKTIAVCHDCHWKIHTGKLD